MRIQRLGVCAQGPGSWGSFGVRASNHQWAVEVDGPEGAVLLDVQLVRLGEAVEAQIVLVEVDFVEQGAVAGFVQHDGPALALVEVPGGQPAAVDEG